jgi:hypothetical protein
MKSSDSKQRVHYIIKYGHSPIILQLGICKQEKKSSTIHCITYAIEETNVFINRNVIFTACWKLDAFHIILV